MMREHIVFLAALRRGARISFRNLEDLTVLVERALKDELAHRTKTAERAIARATDQDQQDFLAASYADGIVQVEADFPRIQRYALFTTAMCLVESSITELCGVAQRLGLAAEAFSSRRPHVVVRGIDYLQGRAALDISLHRDLVELASCLVSLRNCIVHDNGEVRERDDAQRIRAFVARVPTLRTDARDRLELKSGFIEHMSHQMHMLIDILLERMKTRMNAQTRRLSLSRARGRSETHL